MYIQWQVAFYMLCIQHIMSCLIVGVGTEETPILYFMLDLRIA